MGSKQPVSALVIIHTPEGLVLLIERADHPGYWQSVTGSREAQESIADTAQREVREETGLQPSAGIWSDWQQSNCYEIYPEWRHRYPDGVTHNTEHVFSVCVPAPVAVTLAPDEHLASRWVDWHEAAARVFSPSNAAAIRTLAQRLDWTPPE